MLNSLFIKNYKNIPFLELPTLKRVNLLWGKNNVGKSTLLEALSIYASNGNLKQLYELLRLRGEDLQAFKSRNNITVEDEVNAFLPLASNYDKSVFDKGEGIQIGETANNPLKIKLVKINTIIRQDKNGKRQVRRIVSEIGVQTTEDTINSYIALQVNNESKGIEYQIALDGHGIPDENFFEKESVPVNIPFQFISCKWAQPIDIDQLWSTISMSENEEEVITALKIIEPTIERFNILSKEGDDSKKRIPFVRIKDTDKLVRLSSMGDGINRILHIILALINCKGGIFLLDEFENGLHYSVQEQLWKIIFKLANQLNIQVFVTTHSNDCINSFAKVATEEDSLALRMDHEVEQLSVQLYEKPKDLLFAIEKNIEIR